MTSSLGLGGMETRNFAMICSDHSYEKFQTHSFYGFCTI